MHVHLGKRNGYACGVQRPLSLIQQPEVHRPVIRGFNPDPDRKVHAAVRAFGQNNLRGRIRKNDCLLSYKVIQHTVHLVQVAAVINRECQIQPSRSLPGKVDNRCIGQGTVLSTVMSSV